MPTARRTLSDRLNPILVKDLRQLLRREMFVYAVPGLLLLHTAVLYLAPLLIDRGYSFSRHHYGLPFTEMLTIIRHISFHFAAVLVPLYVVMRLNSTQLGGSADPMIIRATGVGRYVRGKLLVVLTLGGGSYLPAAAAMIYVATLDPHTSVLALVYAIGVDLIGMVGFAAGPIFVASTPPRTPRRVLCGLVALPGMVAAAFGASLYFHLLVEDGYVRDAYLTGTPTVFVASLVAANGIACWKRRTPRRGPAPTPPDGTRRRSPTETEPTLIE